MWEALSNLQQLSERALMVKWAPKGPGAEAQETFAIHMQGIASSGLKCQQTCKANKMTEWLCAMFWNIHNVQMWDVHGYVEALRELKTSGSPLAATHFEG